MICDFHMHILPEIDDGSSSPEKSLQMLKLSASHGVSDIVATPHFYAFDISLDEFLERRASAYSRMSDACIGCETLLPKIHLGAETAYFRGISESERLNDLTVKINNGGEFADSNVLLIEMPFIKWSGREVDEIRSIVDRDYRVVIAHVERFMIPENRRQLDRLFDLPVIMQVNCEHLIDHCDEWCRSKGIFAKKNGAEEFFRPGCNYILGSDAHGMNRRPPDMAEGLKALQRIQEKTGQNIINNISIISSELLSV